MITDIRTRRMVVFSDLHLGNPFCSAKTNIVGFLRWASEQGYDICINGDGVEIAQVSFAHLSQDMPEVLHTIKTLARRGTRIWYVVGNHDMAMEHFLDDWGPLKVTPFLNVCSGNARIRVEHGHLYDPFFVNYPRLYDFVTRASGPFLRAAPWLYRWWVEWERLKSRLRGDGASGIKGERPHFAEAAATLARRGFDVVVFGHTHHVGEVQLDRGGRYLNPGSWLLDTAYVAIEDGRAEIRRWTPTRRRRR